MKRNMFNAISIFPSLSLITLLFSGILLCGSAEVAAQSTKQAANKQAIDFERDIQPVLSRFACNSGPCHGKQRGQNGFQLSLLGFDSNFDHDAMVKQSRGRRIFFTRPEASLILAKPAGALPHGGGVLFTQSDPGYQLLLRWIKQGAPRSQPGTPQLERVTVDPQAKIFQHDETTPLKVTAYYADGSTRDVTNWATYQSNESPIAAVDVNGIVTAGTITGEAAVMARYSGHFAIFTASVPLTEKVPADYYDKLPRNNEIDDRVWETLKKLRLRASDPATDHKFLRRVYIDIIGRLPTSDEAREFLEDVSPQKREHLVDQLLADPEYAEHWANKWADLLRPNPYHVGIKTTLNYDRWIRDAFRKNQPYDEFVYDLITANGSTFREGNVTLYRDRRKPDELAIIVSQVFLGVRLECAKCHHHPFEVYGQDDFYSFAAYFAKIGRKGTGISAPISGSEEFIFTSDKGSVKHPLTKAVMQPRPLYGKAVEIKPETDPRVALADWMTSPKNHYFAQTMANRIWQDLMGHGLVEPVDDLRATNPPTNAALLNTLAEYFVQEKFDVKKLIKFITLSQAYSLSSLPNENNKIDTRYFSRHFRQRLRGEVLLDSFCQITGVPESFTAMAPHSRAKELWTHRISSLFLDAYARPDPNQDPPCERISEPTVVQTLHLMNSQQLAQKITSDKGHVAELAKSDLPVVKIIEKLYLSIYARYPTEKEIKLTTELFKKEGADRRKTTEDIMWALLNTPEFVYKD